MTKMYKAHLITPICIAFLITQMYTAELITQNVLFFNHSDMHGMFDYLDMHSMFCLRNRFLLRVICCPIYQGLEVGREAD